MFLRLENSGSLWQRLPCVHKALKNFICDILLTGIGLPMVGVYTRKTEWGQARYHVLWNWSLSH